MRSIIVLLYTLLSIPALAQQDLSNSRQSSAYTYIYRLRPAEARQLFQSDLQQFGDRFLHTKIDSFLSTATAPKMPAQPGNYLYVQAAGSRLRSTIKTVDDLQVKVLNNNRDLVIALHDNSGQFINQAKVSAGRRTMPYDDHIRAFRLPKKRKVKVVTIDHQGVIHYVRIQNREQPDLLQRIATSFPLRYVVKPIGRLFSGQQRRPYRGNYFYGHTEYEKKYKGFLVFSKPRYKPGDTVKIKAWVTTKNGKPVNRQLLLRLMDNRQETDTILTTLSPYRAGGYLYSFVLKDSLDLSLDEEYVLTLEEPGSRKYEALAKKSGAEKEDILLKRKVLSRGSFHYEEYELGTVTFQTRSDKKEHNRNMPVAIYCKATDENELAVMDGRVEILVRPSQYGSMGFFAPHVFLPDTLWHHSQPLETIGETRIVLPDSIFPAASFPYEVVCTFLNSNNEQRVNTLRHQFTNDRHQIQFEQQHDSLKLSVMEAGKSVEATATLYTMHSELDTLQRRQVQLPLIMPLDPFVFKYVLKAAGATREFKPAADTRVVTCRSLRTADSIFVQVINPQRLSFWYTIFAGNKIIARGYADSLLFADRVRTPKHYFVSLQYIYANVSRTEQFNIPFLDKALTIDVQQPQEVYPGQQATVAITVKDAKGNPVQDADVTAYGFTRKFAGVYPPYVPYYGKSYPSRKFYNHFSLKQFRYEPGSVKLNWQRWSREMGLDSIAYYQFLHTASLYINTEEAPGGTTQIAPFVVLKGELQPVHLLYIDEVPYFFSQADQLGQYSFPVKPGNHSLRLRTHDKLILLDNIWVAAGRKTFLSINADSSTRQIRVQKMPDTLTRYEKEHWNKYMLLVENNFGERLATIQQPDRLTVLNLLNKNRHEPRTLQEILSLRARNRQHALLIGPVLPTTAKLQVKNRFAQGFMPEGGYHYYFTQGLIKQKQLSNGKYPFRSSLSHYAPAPSFKDYVLTAGQVDSLWQDYLDHRNANEDLFRNYPLNRLGNGRLQMGTPLDTAGEPLFVKSVILFRYDDPDYARIYKGNTRDLGYVQPGSYRLIGLLRGDTYFIKDSIQVKSNGVNFYEAGFIVPRAKDSTSMRIAAILNNREAGSNNAQPGDADSIKRTFNNQYLDISRFSKLIYGRVTELKSGEPLAGVSIVVKGTSVAAVSNEQGYFELRVPEKGAIQAGYIGYSSVSRRITEESSYDIKMTAQENSLDEVVVVGYGTEKRKSMTGAVSLISRNELAGSVPGIMIRGNASISSEVQPIILVDGVPFTGDMNSLDKNLLESIDVLKSAEATAIYGSRAAGGAILVTTKQQALITKALGLQEVAPLPGNFLRRNFHDDAYWQPGLRTDQQGKASFTITYPDDITNWRSFVVAMGSNRTSGFAETSVRSFKPLTGSIAIPQFAVAGDSIQVIGKTMQYGADSVTVNRTFALNGTPVQQAAIGVRTAHIDSFRVSVPQQDSIRFKYTIQKEDGYFDGEERSIPVMPAGVKETSGLFAVLDKDTSFTLQPNASLGKLTIHAESNVLPVLLEEMEILHRYEYYCNEQMASKLKALLLKKKVYEYLKKDFKEQKLIRELLARLHQGRSQGILWGWWSQNAPQLWISLQVIEALLNAEQQGFASHINKQQLIDHLVYNWNLYGTPEKITAVQLMQKLSAKVVYQSYIDTLERRVRKGTLYEKLQVLQLKQQAGLPVLLDTFLTKQRQTMMGNVYWGEEEYEFFNNPIHNTLAMYRILQKAGNHDLLLKKIRYYFLEKRRDGRWRNTYESSLILETILPDLLQEEGLLQPAAFSIAGTQSAKVTTFPYTTTVDAHEKLTITKAAGQPVYFTAYQQSWNATPQKVAGNFEVRSAFERNGQPVTSLKAGEMAVLEVKVTVKADAHYVMVEIPIPAGCSYHSKHQSGANQEVHREYYKNKVSLFCTSLPKGEYTFKVSLLPRYSGSYHLNPAKAELMYFPVFYGREKMKKVEIR